MAGGADAIGQLLWISRQYRAPRRFDLRIGKRFQQHLGLCRIVRVGVMRHVRDCREHARIMPQDRQWRLI